MIVGGSGGVDVEVEVSDIADKTVGRTVGGGDIPLNIAFILSPAVFSVDDQVSPDWSAGQYTSDALVLDKSKIMIGILLTVVYLNNFQKF